MPGHIRMLRVIVIGAALAPERGHAVEGVTPYLPGATTGVPIGALPPLGFYGSEDNYVVYGGVRDNRGKSVPVQVANWSANVSLLWSSPYKILGGQYGAGVIQIGAYHTVDSTALGGRRTGSFGLFNTIVEPLVLSWKLADGVFVSTGQSVYLRNGEFHVANDARAQTSYASNFYTYEPSFALTYLKGGWNLTAANIFDFNMKNDRTNYSSGTVYYLDLTAVRKFGNLTAGLIGNYTQQISDDRLNGARVGTDGNRVEHVMLGPLLAYQWGRFEFTGRFLGDVATRNDIAFKTGHLSVSTKF